MSSIVEELQRGALNRNTPVSDLLRMAKVISVKLDLPDLAEWVDHELNGYGTTEVPTYRKIHGQLKGKNPYHGWQPVFFDDEKIEKLFTNPPIGQPLAEIEHMLSQAASGSGELHIPLTGQAATHIMNAVGMNLPFAVIIGSGTAWGIIDAVRTVLLDWSLKLEQAGIKGEGLSFSKEEREKAHDGQATYHIGSIGTFTGNLGANSGTITATSHQTSPDNVFEFIEKVRSNEGALNVSRTEIVRLNTALDDLMHEMKQPVQNQIKVRQAVSSIRNVAEGAVGSLAATGILYELGKLFS
jgi:AbiTii